MPSLTIRLGRRRSAAYVALTAGWFLVVALLLVELFLQFRWIPPSALTTPAFGGHPLYASAPLPGVRGEQVRDEYRTSFEHNRLGFRGPLPDLAPGGKGPRLLVVGDSQAYGLGCGEGDTFCDELRRELDGVEVLNTGCNGYGTRDALAIVHHLGAAWQPDIVLLIFFWNDLEDNVKRPAPSFDLDPEGRVRRLDPYDEGFDPLKLRPAMNPGPSGSSGVLLPRFIQEGLRGARYRLFGIHRRSIRTAEAKAAAWEVTGELLGLLAQRCRELDCRLVVASLPDHNQVDPEAVIRNIEPLNFEVQEKLFEVCAELKVPTVDLLPALRERFQESGISLYYYADRHLKPAGHLVVGEQLAKELRPLLESR